MVQQYRVWLSWSNPLINFDFAINQKCMERMDRWRESQPTNVAKPFRPSDWPVSVEKPLFVVRCTKRIWTCVCIRTAWSFVGTTRTAGIRIRSKCPTTRATQQCNLETGGASLFLLLSLSIFYLQLPRHGHNSYSKKVHCRWTSGETDRSKGISTRSTVYWNGKSQTECSGRVRSENNC